MGAVVRRAIDSERDDNIGKDWGSQDRRAGEICRHDIALASSLLKLSVHRGSSNM